MISPTSTSILFLSTPSAGRATSDDYKKALDTFISIHALRGEGDLDAKTPGGGFGISIHALRGEGDSKSTQKSCASFAQRVQSFPRRAAQSAAQRQNGSFNIQQLSSKMLKLLVRSLPAGVGHRGFAPGLQQQNIVLRKFGVQPNVFNAALVMAAQLVKPQAVGGGVDQCRQLRLEHRVLCGIQQALKHRVLHPLTVVDARLATLRSRPLLTRIPRTTSRSPRFSAKVSSWQRSCSKRPSAVRRFSAHCCSKWMSAHWRRQNAKCWMPDIARKSSSAIRRAFRS